MKKIVLTGGGTAGHVTPNIALVPKLKESGFEIKYIGTYNGMEKQLVEDAGLDYIGISSGKLRRYFSWKNFSDPFRVLKGYFEAKKFIKKYKPDIVFSKGGFVTVPVVYAASKYKIPVIIHESDMTPGLANKLCLSSATKVCCNFPETVNNLPKDILSKLEGLKIKNEMLTEKYQINESIKNEIEFLNIKKKEAENLIGSATSQSFTKDKMLSYVFLAFCSGATS